MSLMSKSSSPVRPIRHTDIVLMKYEPLDDSLTMKVDTFVSDDRSFYDRRHITIDESTPGYLKRSLAQFMSDLTKALNDGVDTQGPLPCDTCSGACCVGWEIRLTNDDVEKLRSDSYDMKNVEYYDPVYRGVEPHGNVAKFKMVKRKNPHTKEVEQACVNLDHKTGWCKIWDKRPSVCRAFSAHHCDRHDEWTDKPNNNKFRLPVIR